MLYFVIDGFVNSFLDYYEIVEYKIRSLEDDDFPISSIKRSYIHGFTFNIKAFQRYLKAPFYCM